MILQRLQLENFGQYGGTNIFQLQPEPAGDRHVIVIGGHNGSGKTTFLEAVRLVLYGRRALGPRVSRLQYEKYLLEKIYSFAPMRQASVSLAFSLREGGKQQLYEITRTWAAHGATVIDSLQLICDGQEVENIPREDWEHYVEDLIPTGVSQLFFFDGDKVRDIADSTEAAGFRESVRSVLGLDLVEQLRKDLALYVTRVDEDGGDINLESIERDLKSKKQELALREDKAADLRSSRDQVARRIERAQRAFQQEGGRLAIDREALLKARAASEKRIESLQSELKRLANGVLPLGMAPTLLKRLRDLTTDEVSRSSQRAVMSFLAAFEKARLDGPQRQPGWTKEHFRAMHQFLDEQTKEPEFTFDAEPAWIADRLSQVDVQLRLDALSVGDHLDEALHERDRLKAQQSSLDTNAATEALEALKSAEYDLGVVETTLRTLTSEIDRLRFQIQVLEKERNNALDALLRRDHQERQLDLATRAQRALADYECQVLEQRLETLSSYFLECFNVLIRKKHFVSRVEVDRESFAIALIDDHGKSVLKESLSAGERQIFAISMLWALAKSSGRELPVIIDTPLSHLDRSHRRAIVEQYVPAASHQVILLCTDSELTEDLEAMILPYIARRFELSVSEGTRQTVARPRATTIGIGNPHAH